MVGAVIDRSAVRCPLVRGGSPPHGSFHAGGRAGNSAPALAPVAAVRKSPKSDRREGRESDHIRLAS